MLLPTFEKHRITLCVLHNSKMFDIQKECIFKRLHNDLTSVILGERNSINNINSTQPSKNGRQAATWYSIDSLLHIILFIYSMGLKPLFQRETHFLPITYGKPKYTSLADQCGLGMSRVTTVKSREDCAASRVTVGLVP